MVDSFSQTETRVIYRSEGHPKLGSRLSLLRWHSRGRFHSTPAYRLSSGCKQEAHFSPQRPGTALSGTLVNIKGTSDMSRVTSPTITVALVGLG